MPAFAALETRLARVVAKRLGNRALVRAADSARFTALVDEGVERVGEYGQVLESGDQISVARSSIASLAAGDVLSVDHLEHSIEAMAAMARTSWVLVGLERDDGYMQTWNTR